MVLEFRTVLALAALVAALAVAPVAPEAGNVVFLVAGVLAVLALFGTRRPVLRRPVVALTLGALGLLAVSYGFGAGSINGLVGLVYFAPVFMITPLLSAAGTGRLDWPAVIGVLALCGAGGAAVVAVGDLVTTGTFRAGGSVANPIHFADVALIVGGLSLSGLMSGTGRERVIFWLGAVLALVAVALSGTRGAVVAVVAMIGVAVVLSVVLRVVSLRVMALCLLGLAVVSGLGLALGATQVSGIQRVLADVSSVFRSGLPVDESTATRLQMYVGGFRAFLLSPIVGHGPLEFVNVAKSLADVPFENAPHLHSDPADFAASGGILGLIAYALLLLAPVIEAARSAPAIRRKLVVLASALMSGYFVIGLTNATFGILTVTTGYAAICLCVGILALRRDEAAA